MIWKEIYGYPSYFVSDHGDVRKGDRTLIKSIRENGYEYLNLPLNKKHYVHRLVAIAFIRNPKNLPQVNHKDGNKRNNNVENLEWCTCAENNQHAFDVLGRKTTPQKGADNGMSKLSVGKVLSIRSEYSENITFASLGKKYGVHYYTISDIIKRRTWKHI